MNFHRRREYETVEFGDDIYHIYQQDIGTFVLRKMGE